jgi:hypothetical protein
VLASELWTRHFADTAVDNSVNAPFAVTVTFILKLLSQRFSGVRRFGSYLKDIQQRVNSGYITSVRRAELELFQAGKVGFNSPPRRSWLGILD